MDNKQIAIKLVYDKLGIPFSMDSFEDRLILQKTIYLVQTLGFDLGYHFSWYLKGPYSTSLARDGFAISDELNSNFDEAKNWKLADSTLELLGKVATWFSPEDKDSLARNLELLASVHFLVNVKQVDKQNIDQLVTTLAAYGKDFKKPEVKKAMEELFKNGAFN